MPAAPTAPRPGRAAPPLAWALGASALVLAVGLALSVPDDLPVLRGLPQVAAWAAVVVLAGGLCTGGPRQAPLAVAVLTLAAAASLVDEGGPVDATAVGVGVAGWLCLELTSCSLEDRRTRFRQPNTILRRVGEVVAVATGGAAVGLASLTVAADLSLDDVSLRVTGAFVALMLVGLVAWLASAAADHR